MIIFHWEPDLAQVQGRCGFPTMAGLSWDFAAHPPAHPRGTERLSPSEFLFFPHILKNGGGNRTLHTKEVLKCPFVLRPCQEAAQGSLKEKDLDKSWQPTFFLFSQDRGGQALFN